MDVVRGIWRGSGPGAGVRGVRMLSVFPSFSFGHEVGAGAEGEAGLVAGTQ